MQPVHRLKFPTIQGMCKKTISFQCFFFFFFLQYTHNNTSVIRTTNYRIECKKELFFYNFCGVFSTLYSHNFYLKIYMTKEQRKNPEAHLYICTLCVYIYKPATPEKKSVPVLYTLARGIVPPKLLCFLYTYSYIVCICTYFVEILCRGIAQ